MKLPHWLYKLLSLVTMPLRKNPAFFVFMYVLGCVCAWSTLSHARGAELYDNLYLELFLDVYVLTALLSLLPRVVMPWVRALLYVVFYAVALTDVYCFVKFDSTLTPTMLLLVGETDEREAGEFLQSCVSPDVLFSNVGWVLLIMLTHIFISLELRFPHLVPRKVKEWGKAARDKVASWRMLTTRQQHGSCSQLLPLATWNTRSRRKTMPCSTIPSPASCSASMPTS